MRWIPMVGGRWHHGDTPEHYRPEDLLRDHAARGIAAPGGYNAMIHRAWEAGPWVLTQLRLPDRLGAHDQGENDTWGVMVAGRYHLGPLSPVAARMLVTHSADISLLRGWTAEQWEGHGGHDDPSDATVCPGFDTTPLRAGLAQLLAELRTGEADTQDHLLVEPDPHRHARRRRRGPPRRRPT